MVNNWDGKERRQMGQFDQNIYQKIIETHANVTNLVKSFDGHVSDDKKYWEKVDNINVKIATWTGVGTGVGSIVGFIVSKLFK